MLCAGPTWENLLDKRGQNYPAHVSQSNQAVGKKLILKKEDDFSWVRVWSECEMVLWMSDTTHRREKEHVAFFLYTLCNNECKPVALCRHKWINNICIQFNLAVDRFKISTLIKPIWNHRMSFRRGFDINGDWATETLYIDSTSAWNYNSCAKL